MTGVRERKKKGKNVQAQNKWLKPVKRKTELPSPRSPTTLNRANLVKLGLDLVLQTLLLLGRPWVGKVAGDTARVGISMDAFFLEEA